MKAPTRYHRFAYSTPLRTGEVANVSHIRDGAAFTEITAPLSNLGCEYGEILFNPPFDHKKDKKLGPEHFRFIKPTDLIVLTTRPPLTDPEHGDKKYLHRSYTHLEDQVFAEVTKYIEVCARSHVKLSPAVGDGFDKADLEFYQHKGARLKSFKGLKEFKDKPPPRGSALAFGFFLRTPSIPVYGCGLLACFGMGGSETLIWNRIVRSRYPQWVHQPCFVIGQFDLKGLPAQPHTLTFVDDLKVEILLEHMITGKA